MIYIIKTTAMEKYMNLPIMITEATGEELRVVEHYNLPESGKIWHYYFLDRDSYIKPDRHIAYKWDDKIFQYMQLRDRLKVPEHDIYKNSLSLIADLGNINKKYGRFMITQAHGFYGKEYLYGDEHLNPERIFRKYDRKEQLRVSKFVDDAASISLHLIVGKNFFISPIAHQRIEKKTLYRGGSYPCLSREYGRIKEYCAVINEALMKDGYFGLAHIDFLWTDSDIYFGEINPRIAGSTPYMCYSLEQEYGINMPWLEYEACLTGEVPNVPTEKKCNVEWDFKIIEHEAECDINHMQIREMFNLSNEWRIPFDEGRHVKLVVRHSNWEYDDDKGNNI